MNEINLQQFPKDYHVEIALIVATGIELETALKYLKEYEDDQGIYKVLEGPNVFYCGLFGKYSTVVVKTNAMGSMQLGASQQTTTNTINYFHPKAIIMGGIAFGKDNKKQNFGDILVSDSIITYNPSRQNKDGSIDYRGSKPNTDLTLFNRFTQNTSFEFIFKDKGKKVTIISGPLLTGESLIDNKKFRDQLLNNFPNAIGGEMEGTGIYTACQEKKIPWIVIKSICDWGDGEKNKRYQPLAAQASFEYIYKNLQSSVIFQSLNINPFIKKEDFSPEININALDILSLIVSKRDMKKLSDDKGARNREKKIYYEYYFYHDESHLKGFLFLGNNITLKNIFEHFTEQNKDYLPDTLEIYLAKKRTETHIVDRKRALKEKVSEYGLEKSNNNKIHYIDEIIRDYTSIKGIDTQLHKRKDFIDQKLYVLDNIDNKKFVVGDSLSYFTNEINNQISPISIVVGSGGVGKTTFCDTLQYTINQRQDLNKKVFYIKGEKIVEFFLSSPEQRVISLENLYELYKEETDFIDVDKEDFHLNFIAGNVVVIIDAIEEIESALNERFDLKKFFDSLADLHRRFYSTKIILTTREHFIPKIETVGHNGEITYYELRGFEKENLDAFLKTRYQDNQEKRTGVTEFLKHNNLIDSDGHIIPLFVDWVCKIIDRPESTSKKSSKYFLPNFQMDKLLINLIEREITKQSLNVDIDGMFKLLEEIIIHHKGRIPYQDFKEYIEFETNNDVNNYLKNPLFTNQNNEIKIKYDILHTMVKARHLRYAFLNKLNSSESIRNLLKDLYLGKGDLFNELCSLFNYKTDNINEQISYLILDFIKKFDEERTSIIKENIRKSVSALLYFIMSFKQSSDQNEVTELIKNIYKSSINIHGLFIYGEFYPINFTNITIDEGVFDTYTNLIKCNYPVGNKCVFYYVTFRNIQLPINKKIKKSFFDDTCIYEHSNIIEVVTHENSSNQKKVEQHRQDIIKLTKYIETSQKSENLIKRHCNIKYPKGEKKFLNKLISGNYIELVSNDLYRISSDFYDDIPSIKLNDFPECLEKILELF